MKMLVVDDSVAHRASALEQFVDDDINCVDSYEVANTWIASSAKNPLDVLLLDLLMPAEPYCLGREGLKFLGHEIPIGFILMLRAAQMKIPEIVVITDANHHCHPMSAAIDWIGPAYWNGAGNQIFTINQSRVLIAHAPMLEDGRKDWKTALDILQSNR